MSKYLVDTDKIINVRIQKEISSLYVESAKKNLGDEFDTYFKHELCKALAKEIFDKCNMLIDKIELNNGNVIFKIKIDILNLSKKEDE